MSWIKERQANILLKSWLDQTHETQYIVHFDWGIVLVLCAQHQVDMP